MGHLIVDLAPRLPLRSPRGEPLGRAPDLSESYHRDVAGRTLARCATELRHLGRAARWPARLRACIRQAATLFCAAHTAPCRTDLRDTAVHNEKVYVGREDWLFYRPEIEYLTGHGFLTQRQLARRTGSGNA